MFNDEIDADLGGRDAEPERPGLPGRALVLAVMPLPRQPDGDGAARSTAHRLCRLVLEVRVDDLPRFESTVVVPVPADDLAELESGEAVLAVRVDPDDRLRVAVDFGVEPPEVRISPEAGQLTAAEIVALGEPCAAVVLHANRLGLRSPDDVDLYALTLRVTDDAGGTYRVKVGMPVPAAAVPLLFPGSRLPARRLPDGGREDVVVDWDSALADAAGSDAVVVEWDQARRGDPADEDRAASG